MPSDPLSPEQRAVVDLILQKGMSHGQIARTLDIGEDRVRLMAAEAGRSMRAALEAQAEQQAGDDGDHSEEEDRGGRIGMLLAFWWYLVVIAAGLTYFTVIGLTHH